MADKKYDSWSIKKIEDEILKVRLINLVREKELCLTLSEKSKLQNDHYALAFSYTFLSDTFLACRENNKCIHYLNLAKELSESGHYEDLLVRIYNFYGMLCNSIYDEVSALDYFLKSLDISEKNQNFSQMASAYNNIATCFDIKHNYREAVFYYKKSCSVLSDTDPKMKYSKAVSLTNLCSCAYKLNQPEEIDEILTHFKILCRKNNDEKYMLDILHLYCIAMKYHLAQKYMPFFHIMDEMLHIQKSVADKLLIHQIFTSLCDLLLNINNQSYSYQVLQLLSDINQKNDIKLKKELQNLVVRYSEAFEPMTQQLNALREYYRIMAAIEDMDQESYSAGLLAKLELHNTKAKQGNLKKEKEHLEQLMNTDDLCGTLNRRCLNHDIADTSLQDSESVAIAMLDIDYFKEYNDTYGHHMGDLALAEIGRTLSSIVSDNIHAYRYGGDEFTIIFKNTNEDVVKKTIDRVRIDISEKNIPHIGSKTGDRLTLSCGYAYTSQAARDIPKLLNDADLSLYEVKKNRR